jgi:dihydropteroate synthase
VIAQRCAELAGVLLGADHPPAIMGALNVSPESFYAGSVRLDPGALLDAARDMVEAGASLIDVGARTTAPYLRTALDEREEGERLSRAVEVLAPALAVPVSADTTRAGPARAALSAGARIINDVSGLADPGLVRVVAATGAGLIAMACPGPGESLVAGPLATVVTCLRRTLERARAAGIADERIVLDPGIGFFRGGPGSWVDWDVAILAGLERLLALGRPLCVAVSRKSFLGAITGREAPTERLAGSLAAAALAVAHGASLIRTHDVPETRDAVRVAARIRAAMGSTWGAPGAPQGPPLDNAIRSQPLRAGEGEGGA